MNKKINEFVDSWIGITLMWSLTFNFLYILEVIK